MYIIEYNTAYCKGILWVLVHAYSEYQAYEKLLELIDDVSEVRSVLKQF